jgi:hypothetical protein
MGAKPQPTHRLAAGQGCLCGRYKADYNLLGSTVETGDGS